MDVDDSKKNGNIQQFRLKETIVAANIFKRNVAFICVIDKVFI